MELKESAILTLALLCSACNVTTTFVYAFHRKEWPIKQRYPLSVVAANLLLAIGCMTSAITDIVVDFQEDDAHARTITWSGVACGAADRFVMCFVCMAVFLLGHRCYQMTHYYSSLRKKAAASLRLHLKPRAPPIKGIEARPAAVAAAVIAPPQPIVLQPATQPPPTIAKQGTRDASSTSSRDILVLPNTVLSLPDVEAPQASSFGSKSTSPKIILKDDVAKHFGEAGVPKTRVFSPRIVQPQPKVSPHVEAASLIKCDTVAPPLRTVIIGAYNGATPGPGTIIAPPAATAIMTCNEAKTTKDEADKVLPRPTLTATVSSALPASLLTSSSSSSYPLRFVSSVPFPASPPFSKLPTAFSFKKSRQEDAVLATTVTTATTPPTLSPPQAAYSISATTTVTTLSAPTMDVATIASRPLLAESIITLTTTSTSTRVLVPSTEPAPTNVLEDTKIIADGKQLPRLKGADIPSTELVRETKMDHHQMLVSEPEPSLLLVTTTQTFSEARLGQGGGGGGEGALEGGLSSECSIVSVKSKEPSTVTLVQEPLGREPLVRDVMFLRRGNTFLDQKSSQVARLPTVEEHHHQPIVDSASIALDGGIHDEIRATDVPTMILGGEGEGGGERDIRKTKDGASSTSKRELPPKGGEASLPRWAWQAKQANLHVRQVIIEQQPLCCAQSETQVAICRRPFYFCALRFASFKCVCRRVCGSVCCLCCVPKRLRLCVTQARLVFFFAFCLSVWSAIEIDRVSHANGNSDVYLAASTLQSIYLFGMLAFSVKPIFIIGWRRPETALHIRREVRVASALFCSVILVWFFVGSRYIIPEVTLLLRRQIQNIFISFCVLFIAWPTCISPVALMRRHVARKRKQRARLNDLHDMEALFNIPCARGAFFEFAASEHATENITFINRVREFRSRPFLNPRSPRYLALTREVAQEHLGAMDSIVDEHVRVGSAHELNLSSHLRHSFLRRYAVLRLRVLDAEKVDEQLEALRTISLLIHPVYEEAWSLIKNDTLPRFLASAAGTSLLAQLEDSKQKKQYTV